MVLRPSAVETLLLLFTVLYAVVSRVPLVLLPIYMHQELGFSYLLTGVTDALISVGRLVGAHVAGMHAGIITIVSGMLAGILAWVLILQFDDRAVFICACFIVGLTEVVTGVDVMLKVESLLLKRSAEQTQMIFRIQLIATTLGVVVAYLGGGIIYWFCGVRVLGIVNMVILAASLTLLVLVSRQRKVYGRGFVRLGYIQEELDALDVKRERDSIVMGDSVKRDSVGKRDSAARISFGFASAVPVPPQAYPPTMPQGFLRPSSQQGSVVSSSASRAQSVSSSVGSELMGEPVVARRSMISTTSHSGPIRLNAVVNLMSIDCLTVVETDSIGKTLTPPIVKTKDPLTTRSFLAVVVCCFFFTTFGISTQFAICVVYWNEVWDKGSHISGSFMAAGETAGMIILTILTHPAVFNSRFTSYSGKPANVINATALMAVLAFVTATDSIVACAIGTMGIHVCNVLIHSFQAEMIGSCTKTDDFPRWIARSYVVKRLANTLGVFNSLAVFGALGPQTSYHAVGAGLAVYAVCTGLTCWWLGVLPHQRRRASVPDRAAGPPKIRNSKESAVVESLASVDESDEPDAEDAAVTPAPAADRHHHSNNSKASDFSMPGRVGSERETSGKAPTPTVCKMSM